MGGCKQAGGPQAGWHGGTHHGVRDPWQGKPRGLGNPRLLEEREGDPPPPLRAQQKRGRDPRALPFISPPLLPISPPPTRSLSSGAVNPPWSRSLPPRSRGGAARPGPAGGAGGGSYARSAAAAAVRPGAAGSGVEPPPPPPPPGPGRGPAAAPGAAVLPAPPPRHGQPGNRSRAVSAGSGGPGWGSVAGSCCVGTGLDRAGSGEVEPGGGLAAEPPGLPSCTCPR